MAIGCGSCETFLLPTLGIRLLSYCFINYSQPSYWLPSDKYANRSETSINPNPLLSEAGDITSLESNDKKTIPIEVANEKILGKPTVQVKQLLKTYGSQIAVNNLRYDAYLSFILHY